MVEQGRSPSPESRKPIQKWEVKAIPDAVEQWYKQSVSAPLSPPVAEQKETEEQKNKSPIAESEVSQLIEAVVQGISGGDSKEAQDKKLRETVSALRSEDKILKFLADREPDYAGDMAEEIRTDPLGFGLINSDVRLLPNDAEEMMQRRQAFSFHRSVVHHVNEAMQEGREFTSDDLLEMYGRQRRRKGEFEEYSQKYEAYSIENGMGDFNFSLDNLFAVSQRETLATHLMLSGEENKPLERIQPAQVAAHDLIKSVLRPAEPVPVPSE